MTEDELRARHRRLVEEEIARAQLAWWWLSFVGPEGFRGVCIVEAFGMVTAVMDSHRLGINPGGEVKGYEITADEKLPPDTMLNRLLSRDELIAHFGADDLRRGDGKPL